MKEEKKTRKAPAFQLYTDDFLAGTLDMSQAEVGQLIRLLCHQWNRGSIPVETEKQERLAGGCVSVDVLAKFDECEDGLLRNIRLESVRTEKGKFLQSQSVKGKLSAEKRRLDALERQKQVNQNPTAVQPVLQPDDQPEFNSPSPSPSPKEEDRSHKSTRQRFVPPTLQEVEVRCAEIELPLIEAQKFINYYESKNWIVGKTKMHSWKSALTGWKLRRAESLGELASTPSVKKPLNLKDSL
jgi:uncharacterized protein YdaU (DUF1376 family)